MGVRLIGGISLDCIFKTPEGLVPLDWLKPGDLVETKDRGFQAIAQIDLLAAAPDGAVWIDGANGSILAGQKLLTSGWPLEMYFGLEEMLADAGDISQDFAQIGATQFARVVMDVPSFVRVGNFWIESHGGAEPMLPVLTSEDMKLVQKVFGCPLVRYASSEGARALERSDVSTTIGSRIAAA